ncbi:MAG: hypothetical protein UR69_C0002G0294 [Candidatus Moranbacteria bacterium GW2011_GWE2_35_2-]|nr:MAG: hypothetical protein UR69_C0002G0294 [Candidatus Moranbacteria bacterium GW2011_GWE2_35_2-]KKQ04825.1 MAG: hypothetical protein US15_C0042G0006 [Candidatus Moranbacteria bacterium GW2011_GWF1_36_4]KKQ21892.1 MAG: hypothetical protein US37_C0006G0020 [Candidatus Moranbacteria bacterium GW2011_GWF2_37_11]KKQ29427.1 MAG: hypothetical protein US44_C0001G0019 [Candidatus Moranbacteria bacterium GW2011_GWD1_37_17]KKQ30704.1 MAG: hypothetical protein US47_C0002G0294 [Candidatus Moranbacteria b
MGPVCSNGIVESNQKIVAAGNELDSIQRQIDAAKRADDTARVAELSRQLEGKKNVVRGDRPYF